MNIPAYHEDPNSKILDDKSIITCDIYCHNCGKICGHNTGEKGTLPFIIDIAYYCYDCQIELDNLKEDLYNQQIEELLK